MVFSAKVGAVFLTESSREFPSADDSTNCSSNAYLSWLVGSSIIQFIHEISLEVLEIPCSSSGDVTKKPQVSGTTKHFFFMKNRFHTF